MKLLIRDILRFLGVVLVLAIACSAFYNAGYRYNLTPSIPVGLYRIHPINRPLTHHDIVWFCPPDTSVFRQERDKWQDIPHGDCPGNYMHMFKPVAALPGDTVQVTLQGIFVNGHLIHNSQPMTVTSSGRHMHPMLGTFKVEPDTVWLVSYFNKQSFDSRYVGPIARRQIQGFAYPVGLAFASSHIGVKSGTNLQ